MSEGPAGLPNTPQPEASPEYRDACKGLDATIKHAYGLWEYLGLDTFAEEHRRGGNPSMRGRMSKEFQRHADELKDQIDVGDRLYPQEPFRAERQGILVAEIKSAEHTILTTLKMIMTIVENEAQARTLIEAMAAWPALMTHVEQRLADIERDTAL